MKADVKTLLRKFCLESSVLGVKYLYLHTDRLSRCFWVITILALFYVACILSVLLNNRFEEMPTRITIENQYEPIFNTSFPAVTICSPNQITISNMRHLKKTLVPLQCFNRHHTRRHFCRNYGNSKTIQTRDGNNGNESIDVEGVIPQLLGFYEVLGVLYDDDLNDLHNLIYANRYTTLEVLGLLPQTCEDFIKFCILHGKIYKDCSELFKPILTQHGMCCIFNSIYYFNNKRNVKISNMATHNIGITGFTDSLTIVADYNPEDALDKTLLNTGAIRVIFSDWREFPSDDESYFVLPHVESFHCIQLTYTYCSEDVASLPASIRKCYFEDEYILSYFDKFYNSDCDMECAVNEIEQKCHCTMVYVPYVKQKTACNLTSISCITKTKLQLSTAYETEECVCPRNCISYRYRVEMLTGNLDGLSHLMRNPYADAGIVFNHSTSLMHFFFPTSVFVKQKQETVMSLITLSSNLGGIFGLCLGFSVISVLEILFFIYLAIKNKILMYYEQTLQSNTIWNKP